MKLDTSDTELITYSSEDKRKLFRIFALLESALSRLSGDNTVSVQSVVFHEGRSSLEIIVNADWHIFGSFTEADTLHLTLTYYGFEHNHTLTVNEWERQK